MLFPRDMFFGQDLAWLAAFKEDLKAAIRAAALGRSVSIQGRTVSRQDMALLAAALSDVQSEIDRQNGETVPERVTTADFRLS